MWFKFSLRHPDRVLSRQERGTGNMADVTLRTGSSVERKEGGASDSTSKTSVCPLCSYLHFTLEELKPQWPAQGHTPSKWQSRGRWASPISAFPNKLLPQESYFWFFSNFMQNLEGIKTYSEVGDMEQEIFLSSFLWMPC